MNEAALAAFKRWLVNQKASAEKSFMRAEENSLEEEYFNARDDAFTDVLDMLDKLCTANQ